MAKQKDLTKAQMMQRCKECFPDNMHRGLAQGLVEDEYPYVAGPCCDDPSMLLLNYGLIDTKGKLKAMTKQTYPQLYDKDSHAQMVGKLLKFHPEWGEFIGGVIASFPSWDAWNKLMVRAYLEKAIRTASVQGVDH